MTLLQLLQQKFRDALAEMVPDPEPYAAMVRPTQDPRHGDYQANCAMPLAKVLGKPPRAVAEEVVRRLDRGDFLEQPEVAGPGFINLRVRRDWLAARLQEQARDERLGVARAQPAETIVIDYSSPNVAKPMHVGHLRSTIIGDALARLLRFLGHQVIADNHLGDWGTQFGMLLYGYKHFRDEAALQADPVREMVRLYLLVRNRTKPAEPADKEQEEGAAKKYTPEQIAEARRVLEEVRQETARLHAGDAENVRLWRQFMPWCLQEIEPIYQRLDVHFQHQHGESFYNPMLPGVVEDLLKKGLAQPSEGAIAVFLKEGEPPALVRKRDGAFTYMTSDLATIRYRVEQFHADRLLYVVGAPQALHFQQLFAIARRWGYDRVKFEHIAFGSVLTRRPDGKVEMFRTREGQVVELSRLLDEAVARARAVYEKNRAERIALGQEVPELSEAEKAEVAEVVGLGAVKYADLCQNRTSDYVFDWDKMLAMEGNTAAYMQYAYVRNRGIFRKGGEETEPFRTQPPLPALEAPEERALGLQLLRLGETLEAAAAEYKPNLITAYLWELAKAYSKFFDQCPVLKAATPELRRSRLLLCDLTARVIQRCLQLLGIRTVERM
jgi:arginyl-tRNA synthetase